MSWHKEIWTYLIVTLVAVLIWAWAASETRERKAIPSGNLRFVILGENADWIITPSEASPAINIEGTKLAVQQLTDRLRKPLQISVPAKAGPATVDLAELLRLNDDVVKTGAKIVSTEPATVDLMLDQYERERIAVKPILPGVTAEGEIVVQPSQVMVSLPRSVRQRLPRDFAVEAAVEASALEKLAPGEPQTLDNVTLRFPDSLGVGPAARITPPKVKLTFTIRSRIRETTVESVRVQIVGPPEDRDAYSVDVEPKTLQGVTVLADADLSRRIESGEVPVLAWVHLSSREKELMIDRKAVSMFVAMTPAIGGGVECTQLKIKPGTPMPEIRLRITNRAQTP